MRTAYPAVNFSEDDMRRIAERLQSENPMWMVVFGVYTHEFIAFPRFNPPSGRVVIAAHYPDALPGRLRRAEDAARLARVRRGLLAA